MSDTAQKMFPSRAVDRYHIPRQQNAVHFINGHALLSRVIAVFAGILVTSVISISSPPAVLAMQVDAAETGAQTKSDPDQGSNADNAETPEAGAEVPEFQDGPTLDELLGLDPIPTDGDADGANIDDQMSWDRLPDIRTFLEEEDLRARQRAGVDAAAASAEATSQIDALFLTARNAMEVSADRLADLGDVGITTQRYQDDVLRTLDELINLAEEQQQQQQQQQQQGGTQQQNQDQQQQQAQRDQSNQDARNQQQQQAGNQESQGQDARPGRQEEDLDENSALAEAGVEWGALPARVRNMLLQGRGDEASSLYRRLTEMYYQRLADEAAGDDRADDN